MSTLFPLHGMQVRFAGASDTGRKRDHNEDALRLPERDGLVVVADGMGGHASGDVASRLAVETVARFMDETQGDQDVTWPFMVDRDQRRDENRMVTAVKLANLQIFETAQRDGGLRGMGTTIAAGFFRDDQSVMAHVGDSRIYLFRQGRLSQLTEDHSLLNDYIKMKRLTAQEVSDFPHKNVIVRALGMKETVSVDVVRQRCEVGDVYLFCSDGLTGMLSDEDLVRIIRDESDLDRAVAELIAAANENGGEDNITVALARVET